MNIEFTVCTPTYNRAHTLPKSYLALCNQTCKDFIWLIVDDGSQDNTKVLVDKWIKENRITIQYVYQENAGKQRAINTGIMNCTTKYFGFLDSDDYYCNDTVEKFISLFHEIESQSKIAGIMARRGTDKHSPIGSKSLPKDKFIINFDKLIAKYNFYGDTCRAYYTSVLRKHLYPEIKDKFILESKMLSSIDQKYDLLVIDEVFSISEYLDDGYTKNEKKLYHNNPYGYALGIGQITAAKRGFMRQIKYTLMFTVWCKIYHIDNAYEITANRFLYCLMYPFSQLCYLIKWPSWFFNGEKK